jgi:hypothetical protein
MVVSLFYAPIFRALILAPSRSRMSAIIAAWLPLETEY